MNKFEEYIGNTNKYKEYNTENKIIDITSLYTNEIDITLEILKENFNIIVFVETRKIYNDNYKGKLTQYHTIYEEPVLNKCGGILIYIKKNYHYNRREDLHIKIKELDNIWIEFNYHKQHNTIIGFLYRHPNNNKTAINEFIIKVEENIEKIRREHKNILIIGDINIDLLNTQNKNVQMYIDTLLNANGIFLIKKPTRHNITNKTSTLIDHAIFFQINKIRYKSIKGNIINNPISDHEGVMIQLNNEEENKIKTDIQTYRKIDKNSIEKFKKELQKIIIHKEEEINKAFTEYHNKIINIINEMFPCNYKKVLK